MNTKDATNMQDNPNDTLTLDDPFVDKSVSQAVGFSEGNASLTVTPETLNILKAFLRTLPSPKCTKKENIFLLRSKSTAGTMSIRLHGLEVQIEWNPNTWFSGQNVVGVNTDVTVAVEGGFFRMLAIYPFEVLFKRVRAWLRLSDAPKAVIDTLRFKPSSVSLRSLDLTMFSAPGMNVSAAFDAWDRVLRVDGVTRDDPGLGLSVTRRLGLKYKDHRDASGRLTGGHIMPNRAASKAAEGCNSSSRALYASRLSFYCKAWESADSVDAPKDRARLELRLDLNSLRVSGGWMAKLLTGQAGMGRYANTHEFLIAMDKFMPDVATRSEGLRRVMTGYVQRLGLHWLFLMPEPKTVISALISAVPDLLKPEVRAIMKTWGCPAGESREEGLTYRGRRERVRALRYLKDSLGFDPAVHTYELFTWMQVSFSRSFYDFTDVVREAELNRKSSLYGEKSLSVSEKRERTRLHEKFAEIDRDSDRLLKWHRRNMIHMQRFTSLGV